MSLFERMAGALALAGLLAIPAAAVPFNQFDSSANATLHGNYFVREILLTNIDAQGNIGDAISAIGTLTFDGAGHYTFNGSVMESHPLTAGPQPTTRQIAGNYALGANGFLRIDSLVGTIDNNGTADQAFGGIGAAGPYAFVASTTESPVPNYDLLIGIPMSGVVSNGSFRGTFNTSFMNLVNGDSTKARNATFQLRPNGTGNLGDVALSGYAADQGSTLLNQTASAATYSLATVTTTGGTLSFGTAGNLIGGNMAFMVSSDGTMILGGSVNGFDMLVGSPEVAGATASLYKGFYFLGGLDADASRLAQGNQMSVDAFYGSASVTGAGGLSINHLRTEYLGIYPYDSTYDDYYSIPATGVFQPQFDPDTYTLGASGKVVVMSGNQTFYSMMVGLQAPDSTGPQPWLNPLGVVNAANYAPATNAVAPLELMALFGKGLASSDFDALTLPVPTETPDHVQVLVNGTPAPIFAVRSKTDPQLIFILVPSSVSPANNVYFATFQVVNNGAASNSTTLYTNYTSPGVFATSQAGIGDAAALHPRATYSVVTSADPATVGETVELFMDGLGSVYPLIVPDGAGAPTASPFALVDADIHVYLGGWDSVLPFKGMAPGYTGLYQVNLTVPGIATNDWYLNLDAYNLSTGDGGTNVETKLSVSGLLTPASARPAAAGSVANRQVRRHVRGIPRQTGPRPVSGRMTHSAQ